MENRKRNVEEAFGYGHYPAAPVGAYGKQHVPSATAGGNSFLKLVDDGVTGGGNQETGANQKDNTVGLLIQRAGASRQQLDDEAFELMNIVREGISKAQHLTNFLGSHPEIIPPGTYDVSMLDAILAFLTAKVNGGGGEGGSLLAPEQAGRRAEIRAEYWRVINELRTMPDEAMDEDIVDPSAIQQEEGNFNELLPMQGGPTWESLFQAEVAHGERLQLDGNSGEKLGSGDSGFGEKQGSEAGGSGE